MPPPAKSAATKDRTESKHGVKLPVLSLPQSPKKSNDASSPVKPKAPALPIGPTAASAARAAVSPSSPPKSDGRKRPLAKLGSSPAKPIAPQPPPAAETPANPTDPSAKSRKLAEVSETMTTESTASGGANPSPPPTATEEPSDAAATEAGGNEQADLLRGDGNVRLIYQQYDELFPITGGSTTQAAVDDVYCLAFVMFNCRLHLARFDDAERFARLERGETHESVFVREQPLGTFIGLEADQTYYIVVEQEAERLERDQQAARALWAPEREKKLERDDGRGFESCSCIYGNPCVDEYGCRDWHSRFAVATANGWKGF